MFTDLSDVYCLGTIEKIYHINQKIYRKIGGGFAQNVHLLVYVDAWYSIAVV